MIIAHQFHSRDIKLPHNNINTFYLYIVTRRVRCEERWRGLGLGILVWSNYFFSATRWVWNDGALVSYTIWGWWLGFGSRLLLGLLEFYFIPNQGLVCCIGWWIHFGSSRGQWLHYSWWWHVEFIDHFLFSKYYRLLWFSGGFWWGGCEWRVDFTVEVVWGVVLGFLVLLVGAWVDYGRVSGRSVMWLT